MIFHSLPSGWMLFHKFVAGVLSIYAAIYGFLLLLVAVSATGSMVDMASVYVFGLLCLAATPFIAFFQLLNASAGDPELPTRPVLMAVIMAVPAAFWLYMGFNDLSVIFRRPSDALITLGLAGVPGLLSLWLFGVFVWLALRGRAGGQVR